MMCKLYTISTYLLKFTYLHLLKSKNNGKYLTIIFAERKDNRIDRTATIIVNT